MPTSNANGSSVNNNRCLAVTIGDPGGIGPEVILKSLSRIQIGASPVIFGPRALVEKTDALLCRKCDDYESLSSQFRSVDWGESIRSSKIGIVEPASWENLSDIEVGSPSPVSARVQFDAFAAAIDAAQQRWVDAIVTAPWNKYQLELIGEPARGHTEVLGDRFVDSEPVMMLAGDQLRVSLCTTHIPVEQISKELSPGRIRHVIAETVNALRKRFGIPNPTVSVTGLNPHAGERGIMGSEEVDYIEDIVEQMASNFDDASIRGPFSSDTLFARLANGVEHCDAVVCMYHDQGLIPLKMMHFGEAANVTLGLPIVRTSVDHGTAYDIAGQCVADPGSMSYALRLAESFARRASS